MTGRKLILSDGTEYPEGEAGYSDGHLWLYLPSGTDVHKAFIDFSDPAKTNRIVFDYTISQDEYTGFTDFRGLMLDNDGKMSVHLARSEK